MSKIPDAATSPLFSEKLRAFFPQNIARDNDGNLLIPVNVVTPLDPLTGQLLNVDTFYNVASGMSERQLTPGFFKTGTAAALGNTALWTPTTGKKFRILGFKVFIPSTTTTAAGSTITLKDDASTVFTLAVIGTTTQVINYQQTGMGNGYLSAAANNVLNINCSAALTAGGCTVDVWGTEE